MTNHEVLVAVFPREALPDVAAALEGAGVPSTGLRIDHPDDARAALTAEQHEEADQAFFSPQAGVLLPKEAAKATAISVPLAAVIGALVVLPFSLLTMGDLTLWARAFWMAAIGAAAGGTIAFIATAAMAAKDPLAPSLVERGAVVRVDTFDPTIRPILIELGPIRLDRVRDDGTMERITTDEDQHPGGIAEEVGDNVRREAEADPEDRHR